jgi:hypothetical protein
VVVPTLDDIQNLGEDGTYDLSDERKPVAAGSAAAEQDPAAFDLAEPKRVAPRYDPFTGELIREHELREHELSPAERAPPRVFAITKMKRRGDIAPVPPWASLKALGDMVMARSATVLVVMTLIHAFGAFMGYFTIAWGAFLLFFLLAAVFAAGAGYYSLIIQEIGPGQRDDLPTPLRTVEMRTDVWDPLVHFAISTILCLSPWLAFEPVIGTTPAGPVVSWTLLGLGMFFLPAVFMTLTVDGVLVNLRPDRLLRVIAKGGVEYLITVVTWTGGVILFVYGWEGLFASASTIPFLERPGGNLIEIRRDWVLRGGWPCLGWVALGLYFQYYGCWVLALIWRKHHEDFGWVAQRFSKEPDVVPHAPPPPRSGEPHGPPAV